MRIGIDFRMRGNTSAGIGRYIFELTCAILNIDTENQYYIFYNNTDVRQSDLGKLTSFSNVTLIPTDIRHYSLKEQISLPKILEKYNLDLVHFPNFNVPIRYKRPYVVTIHDMVHHRISGHKKSRILHFKAYKYIIEKAATNAKAIITPSESAKEEITHFFPTTKNNIQVIYEGPSLTPQTEERITKVKKTFLLERPYFLFIGTLERKKNITGLAQGFDEFIQKYKLDMDLVFAGKIDSHYPEEKIKALSIKNANRLVFTGFISDNDLAALLQGAYAYTNASLNEGFGLPGVEAMQFGVPLLVSNTPVFNEVYDSAAIYFDATNPSDIAEKMHLLATDTQFYNQIRDKSLQRGQLFSWRKAAEETIKVYTKVVETTASLLPPIDDHNSHLDAIAD